MTGEVADLQTAFRAVLPEDEALVLAFLDDPLLTYERFRAGIGSSRLEADEQLGLLIKADRWDWALEIAEEKDRAGGGRRFAGSVRLRHGAYLLELGAVQTAHEEVEVARELGGPDFAGWLVLGRVRLAVGLTEEAMDALGRALESGTEAAPVGEDLSETGVDALRRIAFWAKHAGGPDADRAARLEYGRALAEGGRAAEAEVQAALPGGC